MEWTGHALLGLRTAEGLPEWEINLLKITDMSDESIRRAFMPEIRNIREKLGAYCLILDWVYQEEFAHYARLDFSIETDDIENTVYSEDICYNGTRIYSAELSAGMKLRKIEVDISGAKCLIISSRAVPWINEQGIATFSVPDLVIAEPELIK